MKRFAPALVLVLAGCQNFGYQAPYGDDTAQITFTSNDTAAQPAICVPGKGFQSTEYSIAQKPMGGDALNDLLETMKKSTEVTTTLAPSSQTRVGIIYNQKHPNSTQRDRCRVALQFELLCGAPSWYVAYGHSQSTRTASADWPWLSVMDSPHCAWL